MAKKRVTFGNGDIVFGICWLYVATNVLKNDSVNY